MKFLKTMDKIQHWIGRIEKIFGTLAMGFIFIINIYGITSRYVFNRPVLYIQELTILSGISMFFIGMGIAFKEHGGITIDILIKFLPQRIQLINGIIVDLIAIFFMVVLAAQTFLYIQFLGGQGESHAFSFALEIPDSIYFCPIGIGAVSIFLTFFYDILIRLEKFKAKWLLSCNKNGRSA
ncbi:TRAP transporter small permease [Thermodesulfobacteriota bacterium]